MASKEPIDDVTEKIDKFTINEDAGGDETNGDAADDETNGDAADDGTNEDEDGDETDEETLDEFYQALKGPPVILYGNRKDPIKHCRVVKGCQLFTYIREKTKSELALEQALWNHQICFNIIQGQVCHEKHPYKSKRIHKHNYRQTNLCSDWYDGKPCPNDALTCPNAHCFQDVNQYNKVILTETDAQAYRLIRFIRNFNGHFQKTALGYYARHHLYKRLVALMVHLVHILSSKKKNSIEHLNKFLGAMTIKQLISKKALLIELAKPCDVPEVFFSNEVEFYNDWYKVNTSMRSVDFNQLSSEFIAYFNKRLKEY